MKSRKQSWNRISDGLKKGINLVDGSYLLSEELQSALRWIDSILEQPQSEGPEEILQIAGLLRRCAEMMRDRESPFLADEFDRLAADASRLESELLASEGELHELR